MPKPFNARKDRMAADLLKELDDVMTGGQIAQKTAKTGGIHITWSKLFHKTAGNFSHESVTTYRRVDDETYNRNVEMYGHSEERIPIRRYKYTIRLAEKLVTDERRLLDVVAHEWCHLAAFAISGVNDKHGRYWQWWADRVNKKFAHRGIKVTQYHNYKIEYMFAWECGGHAEDDEGCGYIVERESLSIKPGKDVCPRCVGELYQIRPVNRYG